MYCCVFITAIIFVPAVFSQHIGLFSFIQLNNGGLVDCINDFIKKLLPGYQEMDLDSIIENLAIRVASLLDVSEVDENYIRNVVADSIEYLIINNNNVPRLEIPWERIETYTVNNLIEFCSDSLLPIFDYEPQDVAFFLNYILVSWNGSIYDMVQTQKGRKILSTYIKYVKIIIMKIFSTYDIDVFRALIRTLWLKRAQQYFNNSNIKHPYVPHTFDESRLFPISDPAYFDEELCNRPSTSTGHYGNWKNRNPLASREDLERILNTHATDRCSLLHECDIFEVYTRLGVSSAEYYFEIHNDQLYRILFFFLELEARNISSSDMYTEALPANLIPQEIYELLRDDTVYRNYLFRLRRIYGNFTRNIHRKNLASTSRVREEDLIQLLITERPTIHINSINKATPATSTTSTTLVPATSTKNETPHEEKRKSSVNDNSCEKFSTMFSKETFNNKNCFQESKHEILDLSGIIEYATCHRISRMQQQNINTTSNKYYRLAIEDGDSDISLLLFVKEPFALFQLLNSLLIQCSESVVNF